MSKLDLSCGRKKDIPMGITEKNKAIWRILNMIMSNSSFLLLGHSLPDEDCVASLTAFGVLLRKFNKKVCIYLQSAVQKSLQFLADVINYNGIEFYTDAMGKIEKPDVVFVLDTPKPDMIAVDDYGFQFLNDESIVKIEVDHHFDADAHTVSTAEFSLLLQASSTCEIIAWICRQLSQRSDILQRYNIAELYSRNIVLAILTGMVGDAKTGTYLATKRDKRIFDYFIKKFNAILIQKKHQKSSNISDTAEILNIINALSTNQHRILNKILEYSNYDGKTGYIFLDKRTSAEIFRMSDHSQVVSVIKTATNALAENAGMVGISAYYDPNYISNKIQYRVRASNNANYLNLLTILLDLKIEDGGGHPGAIAFRFDKEKFSEKDFTRMNNAIIAKVHELTTVDQNLD